MKVGLGTAQFGFNYGISNAYGQTDCSEIARILKIAKSNDIRIIDTASSYGDSEEVLGRLISDDYQFDITTKIQLKNCYRNSGSIRNLFSDSLKKLNTNSLYGLLIHDPDELLNEYGKTAWKHFENLKQESLVQKIGVSVYSSRQIDYILEEFKIDLIQVPLSIFDQRLIKNARLKKLKECGVEIHARSIFLQGLIFMDSLQLPDSFKPIKKHLDYFKKTLGANNSYPLKAAIDFISGIPEVDKIIIGVNNSGQLAEILDIYSDERESKLDFSTFHLNDEKFLDPSKWNQ